jgi:hypothetical protein
LKNNRETTLFIIVENMGRLNYGNNLQDSKVIQEYNCLFIS